MRDHLIRLGDEAAVASVVAHAAAGPEGWVFALPQYVSGLAIEAYAVAGVAPVVDEAGTVLEAGWAAVPADGAWLLVSVGDGAVLPEAFAGHVAAEGGREDGLRLPDGVVGLSTVWAGMRVGV